MSRYLPELADGLLNALSHLPNVEVEGKQQGAVFGKHPIDLAVQARVRGHQVTIFVELKRGGYPRDAHQAVWQLEQVRASAGHDDAVLMVAAPFLSSSSRQFLQERGVAYWDQTGSLSLDLPWAHYLIDREPPKQAARLRSNLYRGASAQVLHTLLIDRRQEWHLNDLAESAQVANSTAHQVCNALEGLMWMERTGRGPQSVRRLTAPGSLLDAWATAYGQNRYQPLRFHRWARTRADVLDALVPSLNENGVDYALTLEAGASLVAPYATSTDRVWMLVHESQLTAMTDAANRAGLQLVDEGERVTFFVTRERSPLQFRQNVLGLWVASDVQLYLDLWSWPMRGREQARHLRDIRLSDRVP